MKTKLNKFGYPVRVANKKCSVCDSWAFVQEFGTLKLFCRDCQKENQGGMYQVIADVEPNEGAGK